MRAWQRFRSFIANVAAPLVLCGSMAACSADNGGPGAPLKISDVGDHVGSYAYPDGVVEIYHYQDIEIYDDMLVKEFKEVVARTPAAFHLSNAEVVIEMVNFRYYPASVTEGRHYPDIMVRTCAAPGDAECGGGAVYNATVTAEGIVVEYSGLVWAP